MHQYNRTWLKYKNDIRKPKMFRIALRIHVQKVTRGGPKVLKITNVTNMTITEQKGAVHFKEKNRARNCVHHFEGVHDIKTSTILVRKRRLVM